MNQRPKEGEETNATKEERLRREQKVQQVSDPIQFQRRNDIYTQNANVFISNNANPFLISPYGPPANLISKALLLEISTVLSTLIGNLNQVIDLTTFTLRISTIRPITSDPNQMVTISSNILNVSTNTFNVSGVLPGATMNVRVPFNTSSINTSSLVTSTLFAPTFVSTSALSTTTIVANTIFAATSLSTNTIVASTFFAATSISTNNFVASTLFGATSLSTPIISTVNLSTTTIEFGNIYNIPGTLGAGGAVGAVQGSIVINVGAGTFRIPYYN